MTSQKNIFYLNWKDCKINFPSWIEEAANNLK